MKKIVLIGSCTIAFLLILSFYRSAEPGLEKQVTICSTNSTALVAATFFDPSVFQGGGMKIRKNIDRLPPPDINSIKNGIRAMKLLPYTDPTSWEYQAAIHGTTRTNNLPNWNTCHKAGDQFFFLAWHRMYVYFFERILRAKSGDPNLALPYWDYQTNPVLNAEYRNNSAGNPLYDGSRYASMNSGGSLPSGIMTSITNAINNNIPYYDFQSALNGPHGSVHISMGGNMQSVQTAALDPVFWLHHTNIDRLWEEWLRKCNGRSNPVDQQWLTKTYTFYDENGNTVSMSGSQVVDIAGQLSYKYDMFPSNFPCPKGKKLLAYRRFRIFDLSDPIRIDKRQSLFGFEKASSEKMTAFIKDNKGRKINFNDKDAPDKFVIELNSVTVEKLPEGAIEVYLNLSPNEKPDPKSKSFVGLLDLFSVMHHSQHGEHSSGGAQLEIDASASARALKLDINGFQKASISFVTRGNTLDQKEIETSSDLKIGKVSFAIDLAVKN